MADHEDREDVAAEEELWEDLVELEELPDGPTTIFVGGFSQYKSINEALEIVRTSNDRVVVLEKQDGDVMIDTTRYCGVSILGACPRNTMIAGKVLSEEEQEAAAAALAEEQQDEELLDEEELLRRRAAAKVKKNTTLQNIVVTGKLILQHTAPSESAALPTGFPEVDEESEEHASGADGDEDEEGNNGDGNNGDYEDEDGEGGGKKAEKIPGLTMNGLNFTNGVTAEAQSHAYLEDCAFGTRAFQPNNAANSGDLGPNNTNTVINALSTVEFARCQLYGSNKAAIYCYPHSRASFTDCDVAGSDRPLTAEEIAAASAKKPRGFVAPPPPAPSVPSAADIRCQTGVFADNSSCKFSNLDVCNVGIGIYAIGTSKGFTIAESRVKQCNTVGVLFDQQCDGALKNVTVTLCGRECAVLGAGHPTVRECTFVGNVRLKPQCEATGITDNVLGLGGVVVNEDTQFHLKGFSQVAHDPTAPKKKKAAA